MQNMQPGFDPVYHEEVPSAEALANMAGDILLEFGAAWCGHCQRAAPAIEEVLRTTPLRHIKVADGKGKRLGRAYGVKLWPTLILLRDGQEIERLVRPTTKTQVANLINA